MKNKENILIVENDADLCQTVSDFLTAEGYNVRAAQNGNEATNLIKEHKPALIVTDIIMPEKEGIALILEIRQSDKDVKIIAISGGGNFSQHDILSSAKRLGADAVLAKPFDFDELVNLVHNLLQEKP